ANSPYAVAAADFNGDGKPDLATANGGNNSNNVSVLFNNGNGTFGNKVDYPAGASPRSVAAADFNGDGKPDLAVGNGGASSVNVLRNNGDGTFAAAAYYSLDTGETYAVVAADLNGDGKPDLAAANYSRDVVSVRLNSGNGGFSARIDYST